MMERRRGKRVTVSIPVWLRVPPRGQVVTGTARNVGRAGMLIRTAARLPLSARPTVLIWLPDGERESPVLLPATVVHETKGTLGLMLSELDKRAARLLDHLVGQSETPRKQTDEAGGAVASAPAVAAPRSRAAAAARTERAHLFAGRRE
jgi:hypothetical protein